MNAAGFAAMEIISGGMENMRAFIARISGKVQGEGFQNLMSRYARQSGLSGWQRCCSDGSLEVFLQGDDKVIIVLKTFFDREITDPRIEQVMTREAQVDGQLSAFLLKEADPAVWEVSEDYGTPVMEEEDMPSEAERMVLSRHRILFAGDTSLGDYYLHKEGKEELLSRLQNNPFSFAEKVAPLAGGSDHFIVNLETVLAENPKSPIAGKKYANWEEPFRTVDILKKLHITAAGLANNHTMDFGLDAMLQTKQLLQEAGIECFGAGADKIQAEKQLHFVLQGERSHQSVYIVAGMRASKRYREEYAYFADDRHGGVHPLKSMAMKEQIAHLRETDPDSVIIVYPHWQGQDYKWIPPKLTDACRTYIDAGANYVFGHGTHMVNSVEKYQQGIIVHSIGNFIFNSPGRYKKLSAPPFSFVISLEIMETTSGWHTAFKAYPIHTDNRINGYQSYPLTHQETETLVQVMAENCPSGMDESCVIGHDETGFYLTPGDDSID